MRGIFISYRRTDSTDISARLCDRLKAHFGENQVFMDISNIGPGSLFPTRIETRLMASDLVIAVIGQNWARNPEQSVGTEENEDWVKFELSKALESNIPIIPILVHGATMPRSSTLPPSLGKLAHLHAMVVDSTNQFDQHILDLIKVIEERITSDALSYAKKPVITVRRIDKLEKVLELIRRNDFSQFPVVEGDLFRGLLTENGITHWLAQQFGEDQNGDLNIGSITVEDLLAFQEDTRDSSGKAINYRFLPAQAEIGDAIRMFHSNPALEALLLTANGEPNGGIEGIITQWDALEHGQPVGD